MRGSASPQGEARRARAAKAERSECRGGRIKGGGGRVDLTKPPDANRVHRITPGTKPPPKKSPPGDQGMVSPSEPGGGLV